MAADRWGHPPILEELKAKARAAGAPRGTNMVLAGAVARLLPVKTATMEARIARQFAKKGEAVVQANLHAFRLGLETAR